VNLGSEPGNASVPDRVSRAAGHLGSTVSRAHGWVKPRTHAAWLRFRAWADGVAIKWKIFGIAMIGGVMTMLVMGISLFSIWQIGLSGDREFRAVRAREDVISARVKFGEVRTQLFRLAAEPSIGTASVQDAIGALGEAGSALD
jgi:hypothetical protein